MPEPGYNPGEPPPFWVWIAGLVLVIVVATMIQSCT